MLRSFRSMVSGLILACGLAFTSYADADDALAQKLKTIGVQDKTVSELVVATGETESKVRGELYRQQEKACDVDGVRGDAVLTAIKARLRKDGKIGSRASNVDAIEAFLAAPMGAKPELVAALKAALPNVQAFTPKSSRGAARSKDVGSLFE